MQTSSDNLYFFQVTARQHSEVAGVHSLGSDRVVQENSHELANAIEHTKLPLWQSAG